MKYKPTLTFVAVVLSSFLATEMRAGEVGEKGREIFSKNQRAVVTIQVVVKTSAGSSSRESAREITGTVVDPSGLTVVALSACDPTELNRRLNPAYNVESEVSDLKILDDAIELPAEIVLRDKDLDLAFIRPKSKPAAPMQAVDLSRSGTAQVLDEVVSLNRLNKASSRAYSVSPGSIAAVIQKPRVFYIPDGMSAAYGSPVFSLDGKILGIFVRRAVGGAGSGNPGDNLAAIIVPAEDILKGVKQAPPARVEGEKKEEGQ